MKSPGIHNLINWLVTAEDALWVTEQNPGLVCYILLDSFRKNYWQGSALGKGGPGGRWGVGGTVGMWGSACSWYLNVVYRFGRGNGGKLAVVKPLWRQGLERCQHRIGGRRWWRGGRFVGVGAFKQAAVKACGGVECRGEGTRVDSQLRFEMLDSCQWRKWLQSYNSLQRGS